MAENCALCGTGGSGICPDCAELQIVMRYTGWPKWTAQCAIRVWKYYDPNWSAEHIKPYLECKKREAA